MLAYDREGHYTVPSLVRRFLAAQPIAPDEVTATGARHAAHYAGIVSPCARRSADDPHVWRTLEDEHENVRATWDWAVRHGQIAMLFMVYEGMNAWYAHTGRPDEWAEAFGGAVRAVRRTVRDRGTFARAMGLLLVGYGCAQMQRHCYVEAAALFEEAYERARATGMASLEGRCLLAWAEALHALGDVAGARERNREALALAEAVGQANWKPIVSCNSV